jgi:hypothetical protein
MLVQGNLGNCYTENSIAMCEQNNIGWKPTSTPISESEEVFEATPTITIEVK